MKVEISVFVICILVFAINTVLEHLFNWFARLLAKSTFDTQGLNVLLFIFYAIKTIAIIIGLNYITK